MAEDPLAKWERRGTPPIASVKSANATSAAKTEYKAFGEAVGAPRLWIKASIRNTSEAPAYGYLVNVHTDGWSVIGLIYALPFPGPLVIEVRGECLGPLAEAIMRGSASWVQLFDESEHLYPGDGVPIVRDITIYDKPPQNTTAH